MKVLGIIQARMNSSRLPGKVLADIGGRTMLKRVLRRASRANFIDELVIATPDCQVAEEAFRLGELVFTGKEDDVLDRFFQCASARKADAVVRICADNPLIDSWLIDMVVKRFQEGDVDYVTNTDYPLGLGVEVIAVEALNETWEKAKGDYFRVHVTPYIFKHPEIFKLCFLQAEQWYLHHRWTVDTPEDLEFVRAVYNEFGNSDSFGWQDVLTMLKKNLYLRKINAHICQKGLREC